MVDDMCEIAYCRQILTLLNNLFGKNKMSNQRLPINILLTVNEQDTTKDTTQDTSQDTTQVRYHTKYNTRCHEKYHTRYHTRYSTRYHTRCRVNS